MSIYSSTDVYPSSFDDVDLTNCENCNFECGTIGYCLKECGENFIVSSILEGKGYRQANIDFQVINGRILSCIELYTRQCPVFMDNMLALGYDSILYHNPRGKNYLSHVIIENGMAPIDLCLTFMELEEIQ